MGALNTLYQTCFYFSIAIVVVLLAISFVSSLNVWGDVVLEAGVEPGQNTTNAFSAITGLTGGLEFVWLIAAGAGLFVAGLFSFVSRSPTPIAIYIFEIVVWTAYSRSISIISSYTTGIEGFVLIFTLAFVFLTTGAVIGMMSGSG